MKKDMSNLLTPKGLITSGVDQGTGLPMQGCICILRTSVLFIFYLPLARLGLSMQNTLSEFMTIKIYYSMKWETASDERVLLP